MIAKKTRKADLERKRFAFFQIGLILAGSFCLAAFEFVTPVFAKIEQEDIEQDTVYNFPIIPKEYIASTTKKVQTPIINEVKLVDKLPPISKKKKVINQNIQVNLNDLVDMFGSNDGGDSIISQDYGDWDWGSVDKMPEFQGNLGAWISKNIKLPHTIYPISGTVYVSFVVSKTGEVTKVKISRSLDIDHDRAAMAVVKKMPKWKPGEMFGKPVAVNYQLPIRIVNR